MFDVRGSITPKGYVRVESEFIAPRLFDRRGHLSVIGGWRRATEVGFYGFGADSDVDDRANYGFQQPYTSATLTVRPRRGPFLLTGGVELSQWDLGPGKGSEPSVDEVFTPETLPGLGANPVYLHTHGAVGFDWRTAADYTRRGGAYTVTVHNYDDHDDTYSFRQYDALVVQHIPLFRETWALSLRGLLRTTDLDEGQTLPYFMMPALGGGSSLRGFSSWRFRDRHALLLSAEWRVLVNDFLDTALFYDAGRVAAHRSDLWSGRFEQDFGIGFRFHGPAATPLRIELAHSRESAVKIVFAAKASF